MLHSEDPTEMEDSSITQNNDDRRRVVSPGREPHRKRTSRIINSETRYVEIDGSRYGGNIRSRRCGKREMDLGRDLERERQKVWNLEDEIRSMMHENEDKQMDNQRTNDAGPRADGQEEHLTHNFNDSRGINIQEQQRYEANHHAHQRHERPDKPMFSLEDIISITKSMKNIEARQITATIVASLINTNDNIIPHFEPYSTNNRIDIWIKKVNDCAFINGWDEKTTINAAMKKLKGLAKTWYDGLDSILYCWTEWQQKLMVAFPCDLNYGNTLEKMLNRKNIDDELVEVYFYDKLALLSKCQIEGKHAVECIIHGLRDEYIKLNVLAMQCENPYELLKCLMCMSTAD